MKTTKKIMTMEIIKQKLKPKYQTLNEIKINAKNILANFSYLQNLAHNADLIPVLKANAYGHGLKELSLILNHSSAKLLAVDSYPEAQIVYRYSQAKVLILSEMALGAYKYAKFRRTEFVVYNEKTLRYLSKFGKRIKIHLFVNTGMNREGIKDLQKFINNNKEYLNRVEVSGLCSHLASADTDSALNQEQIDEFISDLAILHGAGFYPQWVHLNNSAALLSGLGAGKSTIFTAHRLGLALLGYHPKLEKDHEFSLQAALEIFSHLNSIYPIKSGESVSYNETFIANQDTMIGTIPFGYYEGLSPELANSGQVYLVDDKIYLTIIGKICMNITCLNLKDRVVDLGAKIKVISQNKQDPNSLLAISKISGLSIYQILANISPNIRRTIIDLPS